jgi:hypothetical protein
MNFFGTGVDPSMEPAAKTSRFLTLPKKSLSSGACLVA